MHLPASWESEVGAELTKPYFQNLRHFLDGERTAYEVFPPEDQVFNALKLTPYAKVRVVILGQDPYHDIGQAHGLAFSVPPGIKPPPSLVNIFKELKADLEIPLPSNGCLVPWAEQGVLLLNTVLTVRAHQPHSHRKKGWELFTDEVIACLNDRLDTVIFVLWGAPARKKKNLVNQARHAILEAAHPSPLSAHRGFFGSRPFSTINCLLSDLGDEGIDWRISG